MFWSHVRAPGLAWVLFHAPPTPHGWPLRPRGAPDCSHSAPGVVRGFAGFSVPLTTSDQAKADGPMEQADTQVCGWAQRRPPGAAGGGRPVTGPPGWEVGVSRFKVPEIHFSDLRKFRAEPGAAPPPMAGGRAARRGLGCGSQLPCFPSRQDRPRPVAGPHTEVRGRWSREC